MRGKEQVVDLAAYRFRKSPRKMVAAFAGKNEDFKLYLLAMRAWILWEVAGARRCFR